jgi:MRG-binding protein
MTVPLSDNPADASFLNTVDGDIAFFKSITRARPVGIHRYFHVLTMQSLIFKETGRLIRIEDIWAKLESCYNLEQLEAIVCRVVMPGTQGRSLTRHQDLDADNYESPNSKHSPVAIPSPSPSQNLSAHPFFREEFTLPYDEFESIISVRRLRATASAPSSPTPAPHPKKRSARKRGKSKLDLAGLVGGDSDSSALTQESGDDHTAETPRESIVTGTDAGTDYADEEDVEVREPSPPGTYTASFRSDIFMLLIYCH